MATVNTTDPKPGYVYNQDDDTWYPLLGIATQSLDGLSDVVITTPTTNQVLAYDGTNWVNSSEAGDISSVTAGTGLSGGGATGAVTLSLDTTVAATTNNTLTMSGKTLTTPTINGATISGTFTSTATVTNGIYSNPVLLAPEERMNIVASAATGTIAIDVLTAGTWYYTSNATANHTINVRGSSSTSLNSILTTGDSITVVWLNTNGSTAYYPSAFQVDGSAVTPKWQGGTAPSSGNTSSIDAYVYNIIKTASATFTVLASQTKFA